MRPTDCALLVAVPLQRHEFLADLAAGTDFLANFVAAQSSRDLDVLWATYEASAATAASSAERAGRRGVTVVKRAVLADFARSLRQFQVTTLVAHWRSALFRAGDILDPVAVRQALAEGSDAVDSRPTDAANIAAALNHGLHRLAGPAVAPGSDSHGAAVETRRQYALWEARRALEPVLGAAVRAGGPAVEFSDGSVPIERVVTAVPEEFDGVLDLTVCNSTLLAEEVRRRCRRGLIIANAFPATLDVRMELYNAAVDLVQRREVTYQDAVFGVRRSIRRQP